MGSELTTPNAAQYVGVRFVRTNLCLAVSWRPGSVQSSAPALISCHHRVCDPFGVTLRLTKGALKLKYS